MNKTYLFAGLAVLVVGLGVWFFTRDSAQDVKNYPSSGTEIIAFGDSLVQGVGASSAQNNFVSKLSQKIGQPIVNLGVSGNTTADGLARLSALDEHNPKVVILLLGGNDYLRQVPKETVFSNLGKIIENIQSRGAMVLLLGIRGGLLSDGYDEEFKKLSEQYHTAYVSNVLSGLLGRKEYMFDTIHPNDAGYEKIVDRVYPELKKLLE